MFWFNFKFGTSQKSIHGDKSWEDEPLVPWSGDVMFHFSDILRLLSNHEREDLFLQFMELWTRID